METQILETVLTDMLEEQKSTNQVLLELTTQIRELKATQETFEKKLQEQKIIAPPPDLLPVISALGRGINEIGQKVEAQPKNVIRQVRLLLFPADNADRYYKIIFGRLFPWMGLFITAVFFISLGKEYVVSRTVLQQRRYYFEVYRDAWERLDSSSDRAGKQKMKQIIQKAVNDHQKDD